MARIMNICTARSTDRELDHPFYTILFNNTTRTSRMGPPDAKHCIFPLEATRYMSSQSSTKLLTLGAVMWGTPLISLSNSTKVLLSGKNTFTYDAFPTGSLKDCKNNCNKTVITTTATVIRVRVPIGEAFWHRFIWWWMFFMRKFEDNFTTPILHITIRKFSQVLIVVHANFESSTYKVSSESACSITVDTCFQHYIVQLRIPIKLQQCILYLLPIWTVRAIGRAQEQRTRFCMREDEMRPRWRDNVIHA